MAQEEVKNREARPPREGQSRGPREGGGGPGRGEGRRDDRPRGDDRRGGGRPRFGRPPAIELAKRTPYTLYLDKQAPDSGGRRADSEDGHKSQCRRL